MKLHYYISRFVLLCLPFVMATLIVSCKAHSVRTIKESKEANKGVYSTIKKKAEHERLEEEKKAAKKTNEKDIKVFKDSVISLSVDSLPPATTML